MGTVQLGGNTHRYVWVLALMAVPDEDDEHHKDDRVSYISLALLAPITVSDCDHPLISVIVLFNLLVFHTMEGDISIPSNTRAAVVTGGNKGIGFEVCRQLASGGVTVVLTARDERRDREAVEKLEGLGITGIVFHQLEITDASSISTLADFLKSSFGKLDILASLSFHLVLQLLAASKFGGLDFHQRVEWMLKNAQEPMGAANKSVQTNYYGTKHVTEALLQSSSEGRIVNISSDYGLLKLDF
ncbi:hypothetical protein ACQ4PT_016301 [Festuca glaucescens]